jgi:cephalosporin-C deacetylase-like acetyl esterase
MRLPLAAFASQTGLLRRASRCVLALVAVSTLAWTQEAPRQHTPEERYQLFEQNLKRRAREISHKHLSEIQTLADWNRERPRRKQQFLAMLGLDPLPAKTPLQARTTGTLDRAGYRVEKVVFQSMPGLYVTGNLYLPPKVDKRLPTVLYVCGHSPSPWGAKIDYQHHGIWLARNGYVALLIDTVEFGELSGIHHGTHDLDMLHWFSLGYTPAGPEVWNAIRALDYLETRPEVDPKRIAVTGISGGGAISWFSAAADERIQVAAPVAATWTVGEQIQDDLLHENCDCIYFPNTYQADLPLAGALIAPRPLRIISAQRDSMFPPSGYRAVYERVRRIYELYKAPEKITEYDHDAPHSDIVPFRKMANEWIGRWLKEDTAPFDEGQIQREQPAALRVLDAYPPDAINESIDRSFIPTARLERPSNLEAWKKRRSEIVQGLKDQVFRLLPSNKAPFEAWKKKRGGWSERYAGHFDVEFHSEADVRVQAQLFVPFRKAQSYPALIFVKGSDDMIYPVDWDRILPALANHVVLILHPRAIDYPIDNYRRASLERTVALMGGTIETLQVWDILRSIDYLVEGEGLQLDSVSLFGRKTMAALAFYAAALDPRISRVIVDNPPATHWHNAPLLNVLRVTDLPESAALLAPRELVSLGPLPREYDFTSAIYELYSAADHVRAAGGLGEALQVWKYPHAIGGPPPSQ